MNILIMPTIYNMYSTIDAYTKDIHSIMINSNLYSSIKHCIFFHIRYFWMKSTHLLVWVCLKK